MRDCVFRVATNASKPGQTETVFRRDWQSLWRCATDSGIRYSYERLENLRNDFGAGVPAEQHGKSVLLVNIVVDSEWTLTAVLALRRKWCGAAVRAAGFGRRVFQSSQKRAVQPPRKEDRGLYWIRTSDLVDVNDAL